MFQKDPKSVHVLAYTCIYIYICLHICIYLLMFVAKSLVLPTFHTALSPTCKFLTGFCTSGASGPGWSFGKKFDPMTRGGWSCLGWMTLSWIEVIVSTIFFRKGVIVTSVNIWIIPQRKQSFCNMGSDWMSWFCWTVGWVFFVTCVLLLKHVIKSYDIESWLVN